MSPCRLVPVTCRVIYGTASYRQGQKLSNAFINFPQDKKKKKNVLPDSNGTQTPQSTSTRDYSGVKKKKKKSFLPLPTAPRTRRKGHPEVSGGVRLRALVRSRPRHPVMTLGKKNNSKRGKLDCVQDMQLFLRTRTDSWEERAGLSGD